MRIRSKIITVEYAGQAILSPGEHISGEDYGGSTSFSTSSDSIIDASAPTVRAFGNMQGDMSFSVCVDFCSEDEALEAALSRLQWLEDNQTGVLALTVGTVSKAWQAGIASSSWRISYNADSVRLTFDYNFMLGATATIS